MKISINIPSLNKNTQDLKLNFFNKECQFLTQKWLIYRHQGRDHHLFDLYHIFYN